MNPLHRILLAALLLPSVVSGQAIRDSARIRSDGAELFVELRGADSTRPVVLFLHGGPGDPSALLTFMAYPGPALERTFTMAYLYERAVGKSGPVPDSSHTVAQYVRDVDRVVDYLRRRFHASRVALIGHSWGGTLATLYTLDHGDKVSRLVQVCGPVNIPRMDSLGYATSLAYHRRHGNAEAVADLERIGPPPWKTLQDVITERQWARADSAAADFDMDMNKVLAAGGYTAPDPDAGARTMAVLQRMYGQLEVLNIEPRLPSARTPMLMMSSARDGIVPPAALRPGFDAWGGPKQWYVFERSAHLPFVDAMDQFVDAVTRFLSSRD